MRKAFLEVIEFEELCGHPPTQGRPAIPDERTALLRRRLITEEYTETEAAIREAEQQIGKGHEVTPEMLAEIADGLADLIWVCIGTAIRFGIDLPEVWSEVRAANMAKFGPGSSRREDGKLMKPPGWTPPDVEGVLAKQLPIAGGFDREFEAMFATDLDRQIEITMKTLWCGSPAFAVLQRVKGELDRLRH